MILNSPGLDHLRRSLRARAFDLVSTSASIRRAKDRVITPRSRRVSSISVSASFLLPLSSLLGQGRVQLRCYPIVLRLRQFPSWRGQPRRFSSEGRHDVKMSMVNGLAAADTVILNDYGRPQSFFVRWQLFELRPKDRAAPPA